MAHQRKTATDRKAEIVQTAILLAGEHGPDRVTTQQLADAIGISQPAIFRHFPTKADIWLAVGEMIARRMAMQDMDSGSGDPLGELRTLIDRHLGQIVLTPALPAILFSRELHAENEPLRQHFETVMANRRSGFAGLIRRAQGLGQLGPSAKAEDIAALILATIQGLATRWSLENRSFDLEVEGGRLIGILMDGFRSV